MFPKYACVTYEDYIDYGPVIAWYLRGIVRMYVTLDTDHARFREKVDIL